jgi:hypothetical protein
MTSIVKNKQRRHKQYQKYRFLMCLSVLSLSTFISSCAPMNAPDGRTVDIPPAAKAEPRTEATNEGREPVLTIPLGADVLVPAAKVGEELSKDQIGPYELRSETLAAALQLVLANYDIPIAFQTNEGLTRTVTVANLKGTVSQVVKKLCGLADLYCTYENGILEVKDKETFIVSLPPLDDAGYESISGGLAALSGAETVIDASTRTLIYTVTQRNAERAERYFDRLRANTALIVYETYIWEVQLDSANSAGIKWQKLSNLGAFNSGISIDSAISGQVGTPITIGLPTKGNVNLATGDVLDFLTKQGAVKTISQPQLTVLSGSEADLRVAETINYIESLTRTIDDNGDETVSTTTAEVDTGFTLKIGSSWDQSTVYANIELEINEFLGFEEFDAGSGESLQLPRTSERELTTQVRSRPGDSILIAGLVRERDVYDVSGIGTNTPIIPTGRTGQTDNTELVILLRPRVVRYVSQEQMQRESDEKSKGLNEFSLSPAPSDIPETEFDIDLLLNPSVRSAPMEVK